MTSEGIIRLNDCNVHVALMGSEFDEQGTVYIVCNYNVTCFRNDLKMMYCSVVTQANSEFRVLLSGVEPNTFRLLVRMGTKAIKLGSWDKYSLCC